MKKYKLINRQTKEEYLCEKVVIDGFDYYITDTTPKAGEYKYSLTSKTLEVQDEGFTYESDYKVIATNNPNIDIPKVVDEVEELVKQLYTPVKLHQHSYDSGVRFGYNHSQSTHPNSDEDVKDYLDFVEDNYYYHSYTWYNTDTNEPITKEKLFEAWKDKKVQTIYFK